MTLEHYGARWVTHHDHTAQICEAFGYRAFSDPQVHFRLVRWLYVGSWVSVERPSLIFDRATSWLVERKILLPGVTTLCRLIAQVRERSAERLWSKLARAPSRLQCKELEQLLVISRGTRQSALDRLRQGPTRASGPALIAAIRRLEEVRAIGVGNLPLGRVPPSKLQELARYAACAWAPTLARMPDDCRIATLLAFVRTLEVTALDDVLDLFDALVTEIFSQAERLWEKERLRTLGDLDDAARTLRDACRLLLDPSLREAQRRRVLFARIPREQLDQALARVDGLVGDPDTKHRRQLVDRYRRIRRFLPHLLTSVPFQATPAGRSLLKALAFLNSWEGRAREAGTTAPCPTLPARPARCTSFGN